MADYAPAHAATKAPADEAGHQSAWLAPTPVGEVDVALAPVALSAQHLEVFRVECHLREQRSGLDVVDLNDAAVFGAASTRDAFPVKAAKGCVSQPPPSGRRVELGAAFLMVHGFGKDEVELKLIGGVEKAPHAIEGVCHVASPLLMFSWQRQK